MAEKTVINIVTTQCQPGDEEKFNTWYNHVHVPMLLKSKQLMGATRYKAISEPGRPPRYLAVYKHASLNDYEEFQKSPELAAAIQEMQSTWGKKMEIVSVMPCEFIKSWGK